MERPILSLNRWARRDLLAGATLPVAEAAAAERAIAAWDGYAPTPVCALPSLARRLGVAEVGAKLEGERFAVGSFKALGPPYALERALAREGVDEPAAWTAVAATSGNHGRALAWGARRLGVRCRIFMPAHTSPGRAAAIAAFGAEIVWVDGDFDDALAAAEAAARAPRTLLVADLVVDGRAEIPADILAGYSVIGAEIAARPVMPSHVFIAAGNGTLAAAIASRLAHAPTRPMVVTVEPLASDAVRRSLAAGERVVLTEPARSLMDGLVVRAPSVEAWGKLRAHVDAGLAIGDAAALEVLRTAASGGWGDSPLAIGETGIAALAGLVVAAENTEITAALGIDPDSRLLAVACEGVTDPAVFAALTA